MSRGEDYRKARQELGRWEQAEMDYRRQANILFNEVLPDLRQTLMENTKQYGQTEPAFQEQEARLHQVLTMLYEQHQQTQRKLHNGLADAEHRADHARREWGEH
ncbi:MAG: hypothetical protein LKI92_06920 [Schleiferilactobacillus harbinensis]|jgi:hypothetical protein|nr:hypothetical protein [Schleiferilactobacillus harbinensis]MCI1913060.1 hypothetical protein [Schleiferilactobacillus harbinensis]